MNQDEYDRIPMTSQNSGGSAPHWQIAQWKKPLVLEDGYLTAWREDEMICDQHIIAMDLSGWFILPLDGRQESYNWSQINAVNTALVFQSKIKHHTLAPGVCPRCVIAAAVKVCELLLTDESKKHHFCRHVLNIKLQKKIEHKIYMIKIIVIFLWRRILPPRTSSVAKLCINSHDKSAGASPKSQPKLSTQLIKSHYPPRRAHKRRMRNVCRNLVTIWKRTKRVGCFQTCFESTKYNVCHDFTELIFKVKGKAEPTKQESQVHISERLTTDDTSSYCLAALRTSTPAASSVLAIVYYARHSVGKLHTSMTRRQAYCPRVGRM